MGSQTSDPHHTKHLYFLLKEKQFPSTTVLQFVQGFKLRNHVIIKVKIKPNGFEPYMKSSSIEHSMKDGNSFLPGIYFLILLI